MQPIEFHKSLVFQATDGHEIIGYVSFYQKEISVSLLRKKNSVFYLDKLHNSQAQRR